MGKVKDMVMVNFYCYHEIQILADSKFLQKYFLRRFLTMGGPLLEVLDWMHHVEVVLRNNYLVFVEFNHNHLAPITHKLNIDNCRPCNRDPIDHNRYTFFI